MALTGSRSFFSVSTVVIFIRAYIDIYIARLFALAGHERIVGRVLNRALVFGVNEAKEGENETEGARRKEFGDGEEERKREKEKGRFDGAH